ncbi:MAG: hypothetical protein FWG10_08335 [Eubacteriaceae bacterium]|nr:hypothetical protein [Eubacteriaceae bacterium]
MYKNKPHTRIKNNPLRTIALLALAAIIALPGSACSPSRSMSNPPASFGGLDTRASASLTFGEDVLGDVGSGGEPALTEDAVDLAPGNKVLSLKDFMVHATATRKDFLSRLGKAFAEAGVQTSYENEIIRLDTLEFADFFMVYSAWDDGPEAILEAWKTIFAASGTWTIEVEVKENDVKHMLLSRNGIPTVEFVAKFLEPTQYFYGIYRTVDYRLEIDIARTSFGFACQVYEPETPALYRFAYADDGSNDGSIGYTFDISQQPAELTGDEALTFASHWPELAGQQEATYITVIGPSMSVSQSGVASEYPITATAPILDTINTTDGNMQSDSTATTQTANPYARLWHGSEVLASNWSERFALEEDGSFIWCANEMDGASRVRYLAGEWEVVGGELVLAVQMMIGWDGGEVVENNGIAHYASSQVILNPTLTAIQVDEVLRVPISEISHDSERGLDTVKINELQCWDYSSQSEDALVGFWEAFVEALFNEMGTMNKSDVNLLLD